MKSLSLITFTIAALFFSGCSSKKYFEPEQTFSASSASTSYGGSMSDISREGGTLESGQYIGKSGLSSINLGEGYRFLNENEKYVLATNTEGILKIIDKNTKEAVRAVSLKVPVVSATIKNGVIAYILNSNTFGIYQMADNKKVVESRSETTFAIDTRAASPIFIDNLVVMPMLDGKLIIVNIADSENAKVVYLSTEKVFNNVIYLSRKDNTMIAATPKKLLTLGNGGQREYRENISEVAYDKGVIYLFTKEGKIIALNDDLEKAGEAKYKFAHFSVGTAFNGRVYGLEQGGSLIVMDSALRKQKIYELGEVDEPALISGTKLYKDGDIIELSKLGYE
jgi:PBP1b-binding outer membrane lipoprotein LpoB